MHTYAESSKAPIFSADQKIVDKKFLMMKTGGARISKQHNNHHVMEEMVGQDEHDYWQDDDYDATARREERTEETENEGITPIWDPTPSYSEDDEHMFCMGCVGESLTHPAEP